jgi:hypothetical protein
MVAVASDEQHSDALDSIPERSCWHPNSGQQGQIEADQLLDRSVKGMRAVFDRFSNRRSNVRASRPSVHWSRSGISSTLAQSPRISSPIGRRANSLIEGWWNYRCQCVMTKRPLCLVLASLSVLAVTKAKPRQPPSTLAQRL